MSSASAQVSQVPQVKPFDTVLQRCLARPSVSILDCARTATLATERGSLHLDYSMDPATGQPESGAIVEVCQGNYCDFYDCGTDDNSSYCTYKSTCHYSVEGSECDYTP